MGNVELIGTHALALVVGLAIGTLFGRTLLAWRWMDHKGDTEDSLADREVVEPRRNQAALTPIAVNDFSFRLRFNLSPGDTINMDAPEWSWQPPELSQTLLLKSCERDKTIKEAKRLVLRSSGWPSIDEASEAGERFRDVLMLTLARLRVGADFGNRAPRSIIFQAGLHMFKQAAGQRILQDIHGLMAFPTDPPPRFMGLGPVSLVRGVPSSRFERLFMHAASHPHILSDRERVALDLYNASFFTGSADGRFLALVMAIEALLEPAPRPEMARQHVNYLIELTNAAEALAVDDKRSLKGILRWMLKDSINQTGRKLVASRLGERQYDGRNAVTFFSHCYDLRSRLVHGAIPPPSRDEINSAAAPLEVFVSDLLSGPLRDVEF